MSKSNAITGACGRGTRPGSLWRKSWSSKKQQARHMLQLPIIYTIHKKLQGVSWRFWSGLRGHLQTYIIQGQLQEVQLEDESVLPMIILEPWRYHHSGQRPERPHNSFRHINTYSTLRWILEIPDRGNYPNRRNKTVCQETFYTPEIHHQTLRAVLGTVIPSTLEQIWGISRIY